MTADGMIGKHIGQYYLVEKLGSGGFGHVYKAHHVHLPNRVVAFKMFKETEDRTAFLREAHLLDQLRHPGILSVLDVGIYQELPLGRDFPYMVIEYAPGGTLQDRLRRASGPMDVDEVINLLSQVAESLMYAHQQGIVHRDLKPANILFDAFGATLLADFGIAIVLSSGSHAGDKFGTPAYMAPEQFKGGKPDFRSDQYALGCIAYELLTGRLPFAEYQGPALAYQHVHEEPPSPRSFNPSLPDYMEWAILKALAKNYQERYDDELAFIQALKTPSRRTKRWAQPAELIVGVVEEEFPRLPIERGYRDRHYHPTRRRDFPRQAPIQNRYRDRSQFWSDSFLPQVRRPSQRQEQVREAQNEEEELPRRRRYRPERRGRDIYSEDPIALSPHRVAPVRQTPPVTSEKDWWLILLEPCCALLLIGIIWVIHPDARSSPANIIALLLLIAILCFHSSTLIDSYSHARKRWRPIVWLAGLCLCFWGIVLLFSPLLIEGQLFFWFEGTLMVSACTSSLYWWIKPSR